MCKFVTRVWWSRGAIAQLHHHYSSLKKINFAKSDKVKTVNVGVTCEICSILDCEVRQAPPVRLEKERANEAMKNAITSIRKEVLK